MKIFAVGMNYLQHNKELHGALYKPDAPVIFTKADSSLLKDKKPLFLPEELGRIDYETELVVRICRLGKGISQRFAHRYYDAVTVGIDFTARDLQRKLCEAGQPWDLCKGFADQLYQQVVYTEDRRHSLYGNPCRSRTRQHQ